jgi:DNA polymerase III epsilon subunit-like protein
MSPDLLSRARLVALDLETSGSMPGRDRIVEIGLVEIEALRVVDTWTTLVRPPLPAWSPSAGLSGLGPETAAYAPALLSVLPGAGADEVLAAPVFDEIAPLLAARLELADGIVCHNAHFDMRFLQLAFKRVGVEPVRRPVVDTLEAARAAWGRGENSLGEVAGRLGVVGDHVHRALPDARLTAGILIRFADHLGERFRLDEFPGYVYDASDFLESRASLPFRGNAETGTRPSESQHPAVILTLLKSAVRSARQVSALVGPPGPLRREERFIPLRIHGDQIVVKVPERNEEMVVHLEDVHEVRW